jgi:hypothetical protein
VKEGKMLFNTTEEQRFNLNYYIVEMLSCGLDRKWVEKIDKIARERQGMFDLVQSFYFEQDVEERKKILQTIKECDKDQEKDDCYDLGEMDSIFDC